MMKWVMLMQITKKDEFCSNFKLMITSCNQRVQTLKTSVLSFFTFFVLKQILIRYNIQYL